MANVAENNIKKKKTTNGSSSKTNEAKVKDKTSNNTSFSAGQTETSAASPSIDPFDASQVAEISFLPEEIQSILVSFKSQLSEAPVEIRETIGKFLFGNSYFEKKSDVNQVNEEDKKIITANFEDVNIPDGFQNLPPIMIYSASANNFVPIRALAVDVLQWGSRPVIIARSSSSVKVMSSEGKIVQIPPKMVFAILAESDLVGFVRHLNEDPEGSYEIFFAPSCIQKDDSGNSIVRYKVAIGTRVPKSAVWPSK